MNIPDDPNANKPQEKKIGSLFNYSSPKVVVKKNILDVVSPIIALTLTAEVEKRKIPLENLHIIFLKKLKKKLMEEDWLYQEDATGIQLVNQTEPTQMLSIKTQERGVIFSVTAVALEQIAVATNIYIEVCERYRYPITFTLQTADRPQAFNYLRELKKDGFDINLINKISCQHEHPLSQTEDEFTADLLAEVQTIPSSTSKLRNS